MVKERSYMRLSFIMKDLLAARESSFNYILSLRKCNIIIQFKCLQFHYISELFVSMQFEQALQKVSGIWRHTRLEQTFIQFLTKLLKETMMKRYKVRPMTVFEWGQEPIFDRVSLQSQQDNQRKMEFAV